MYICIYMHIYTYKCIYTVIPRPKGTFCGETIGKKRQVCSRPQV